MANLILIVRLRVKLFQIIGHYGLGWGSGRRVLSVVIMAGFVEKICHKGSKVKTIGENRVQVINESCTFVRC